MLNILIGEGTPAVWQAERADFGLPSNFSLVAAAVQLHQPGAHCVPLNIADGETLPSGITLSDFDGVMFPGSPLHIYDSDPCVTRQIDFARIAFAAACRSGAAAGACSWPWWRLEDRSGATRAHASCRSLGRSP
jgi:GMP synthase (glutamine-hydrolysing)